LVELLREQCAAPLVWLDIVVINIGLY